MHSDHMTLTVAEGSAGSLVSFTMAMSLVLSGAFIAYLVVIVIPYLRQQAGPVGEAGDFDWHFIVPCRDEEAVIAATVTYLRRTFPRSQVWVVDDDSDDATATIVERISQDDERVRLVRRVRPEARTGKGDALNAAFRRITSWLPPGHDPDRVVLGVVDADGRPAANCLRVLAAHHLFGDPRIGAVQIEVRMLNRHDRRPLPDRGRMRNFLARNLVRLQDMEFRTTIAAVQLARRSTRTAAMGGNGQFTRLTALQLIDRDEGRPWRGSLLEDFELGLHLLLAGQRSEFTSDTWVEQEGLFDPRRFLTQRTRWGQGVMQCIRYLPHVWRSGNLTTSGVMEITYYLLQPWLQIAGTFIFSIPLIYLFTNFAAHPDWLVSGHGGMWTLLVLYIAFGVAQFAFWGILYWWRCERHEGFWRGLGYGLGNVLYVFCFYFTTWRALARIVRGRGGWAKTRRNAEISVRGPVAKEA